MKILSRKLAFGLFGLLAAASLLSAACGGGGSEAGAVAPDTTQPKVTAQQATPAPAAATVAATVAPAATPVPATPVPATPAPVQATHPPAPTPAPPPAPVDVTVTLSEFKIDSSLTTFQAGVPYHFIVTNDGKIPHEINIANLTNAQMPVGATQSFDITFTSQGQPEFACHLPAHYEAGMKLPITVGP